MGIGEGDFGAIIKNKIKKNINLFGVEIWKKYQHPQWKLYNKIYFKDIRKYLQFNKSKFDGVLLVDVIEHFNKTDGKRILSKCMRITNNFIVLSTPITVYPQSNLNGNPYEKHKYFWNDSELKKIGFKRIFLKKIKTYSANPKYANLGIYVFEKVRR